MPAGWRRLSFARDGPRVPLHPRAGRQYADRAARLGRARRPAPAPGEARVPESGRLPQGPDRARDDREGRGRGKAQAGRDDRRADLRQHGRRARDRGREEGLPLHLRDAGQDEPGEDLDAAGLRRGSRDLPDRRRAGLPRVLLLRLRSARRGDPRRLQAGPVLEHVQPGGALPRHGARDLGADRRRDRRDRHLRRDGRDDLRRRSLVQGTEAGGADRRRRPRRLRLHGAGRARRPPVSGRGNRQGRVAEDDGSRGRGRVGARLRPRLVPDRAAARPGGGTARRRLRRNDRVGGGRDRGSIRPGGDDPHHDSRLGPLLHVEVLRRQLDARARLRRAARAAADRLGAAPVEAARGDGGAGAGHDRGAPEGRRGDRRDAAILDLAAAGRARQRSELAG